MSHKATNWLASLTPTEMTHGEFRVLFHLCDCHNPSQGCFPSQTYLRDHTGLSNGGLNKALGNLEVKGLIKREQRNNPKNRQRLPSLYILGFEMKAPQEPTPLSGDGNSPENDGGHLHSGGEGANSTFQGGPSPLLGGGHLHPSGVDIDEPVKEPVKEPCEADAPHNPDFDFSGFFDQFADVFPRMGDAEKTEDGLRKALGDGADPAEILAGAKAYALEQAGNKPRYIKYSENWIEEKRWRQHVTTPVASVNPQKVLEERAKDIKARKPWARTIKASQAGECIIAGLVTIEQCQAAGINV